MSHAVKMEITAAVDHLHALCVLVFSGFLHLAAPATLARGALETASTAIWIMSPTGRNERITRALQWAVLDIRDSDRATTGAGIPVPTPLQDRLDKVETVAVRRGLDFAKIRVGFTSTHAVTAAEAHTKSLRVLSGRFGLTPPGPFVYSGGRTRTIPEPSATPGGAMEMPDEVAVLIHDADISLTRSMISLWGRSVGVGSACPNPQTTANGGCSVCSTISSTMLTGHEGKPFCGGCQITTCCSRQLHQRRPSGTAGG